MASPPDYDKEPKAPDKRTNNIHHEDLKTTNDSTANHLSESDSKSHNNVANTDVETKHVETLDDGQLRALLDEAITYKCPKDREGKSSLFKELLEEVEQDEQACEAAARELTGSRGRRAGKGRRALPHSNSLQDLVAALAAEPAPRRRAAHAPPAQVSARAIHGGSLPSGVDTSFLLSEEPTRGGYLATVRCVNPPPLSERRVSIDSSRSDNESRRSKPSSVGVTYTARATLEIGGAGRAVTTTSPSNQAKLMKALTSMNKGGGHEDRDLKTEPRGPHRDRRNKRTVKKEKFQPQGEHLTGIATTSTSNKHKLKINKQHANMTQQIEVAAKPKQVLSQKNIEISQKTTKTNSDLVLDSSIHNWYKGLVDYSMQKRETMQRKDNCSNTFQNTFKQSSDDYPNLFMLQDRKHYIKKHSTHFPKIQLSTKEINKKISASNDFSHTSESTKDYGDQLDPMELSANDWNEGLKEYSEIIAVIQGSEKVTKGDPHNTNTDSSTNTIINSTIKINVGADDAIDVNNQYFNSKMPNFAMWQPKVYKTASENQNDYENVTNDSKTKSNRYSDEVYKIKQNYRERVGKLEVPKPSDYNPKNIKKMTIGKPITENVIKSPFCDKISTNSNARQLTATQVVNSNNIKRVKGNDIGDSENCRIREVSAYNIFQNNNNNIEMKDMNKKDKISHFGKDIEMIDMPIVKNNNNYFSKYYADQQKLFYALEESNFAHNIHAQNLDAHISGKVLGKGSEIVKTETVIDIGDYDDNENIKINSASPLKEHTDQTNSNMELDSEIELVNYPISRSLELGIVTDESTEKTKTENQLIEKATTLEVITERKPGDHYILAELSNNAYIFLTLPKRLPTLNQDTATVHEIENNNIKPCVPGEKIKSKKKKVKQCIADNKNMVINKDVLRDLLFENLIKHSPATSSRAGLPTINQSEVDSAIPFSCITTPEVVSSCNTTTATAPSANIVDPKPRNATTSSVNGTPRPNLAACAPDDYKKSLDENGNAVQSYGTVLSSSSQHKKPRRKKTSKNEIVIKSHQIDGYQGNKDLNEVLRFIESHAARPKLRKHRDDADEKKSRGSRRKDKEGGGAPRAASLEEVSRTTLEELTCAAGDAAAEPADADAEFTTVTKRRARRRREPPPAAAPRSDRSADSPDEGYAVPDLISSCREYPALPPPPPRRPAAAPDLVADRRAPPPVVLRPRRASPASARHLRGVTFGFELNETLLAVPARAPPPCRAPPLDPRLLDHLVAYVAHAWEDVVKCGNGKVRYYSE